jgi:hypothetical protein
MKQGEKIKLSDSGWKLMYKTGGVAAILAGVLFRRNLGVEIALFHPLKQPTSVIEWFELLQDNRLLGLAYLNLFDLVNYALLVLMLLALYGALRGANRAIMLIATTCGLIGMSVYFATNTALSMLSLSGQHAGAASEAQRAMLEAAGQSLLALNRFSSPGAQPGSGGYLSLLLVAISCLLIGLVMLKGRTFNRLTAVIGLLAAVLDLVYCIAFISLPGADSELLSLLFIPAAGLFWMVWHILVGWRLYQLGRSSRA